MVGREELLKAISRVGEKVGEGDSLYCRHGGGSGSRSDGCIASHSVHGNKRLKLSTGSHWHLMYRPTYIQYV